jgi:hypothetical protein
MNVPFLFIVLPTKEFFMVAFAWVCGFVVADFIPFWGHWPFTAVWSSQYCDQP